VDVTAADNVVSSDKARTGVFVIGGWDNFVAPGCIDIMPRAATDNQVNFESTGLRVEDTPTAIFVIGAASSSDAGNADHQVRAEFSDTTLVNTDTGFLVFGERNAYPDQVAAPVGEDNQVEVVIEGTTAETAEGEATTLPSTVGDCRPEAAESCTNTVTIAGPAQTFAQENPGLNSDDFLGHYTGTEDKIANAMSAGPAVIAEEATIMDWPAGWPGNWPAEPGGEPIELRPGSNGWTCLPDRPETPTNDPLCLNEEMLAWRKAIIDKTAPEPRGVGIAYMLQGGSSASTVDPFLLEPPAGEDWGSGPAHLMILTPGGEQDLAAFGTTPGPAPWVMNSGSPYAHLMVALPAIPEPVPMGD
jgi:hypothetical protein